MAAVRNAPQPNRDRMAMTIVTDLSPVLPSSSPAAMDDGGEHDGDEHHGEDILGELPRLPRSRAVTRAESEDFAHAEVSEPTDRRTPRAAGALTPRGAFSPRVKKAVVVEDAVALEPAAATAEEEGALETPGGEGTVGPNDFELLCVIGQGAFGKVCSCRSSTLAEVNPVLAGVSM